MDANDEYELRTFAEEAKLAAEELETYGGSLQLAGKTFIYSDAPRLRKVYDDILDYIENRQSSEAGRMNRILKMYRNRPKPQAAEARKPGKTYTVNRSMRYNVRLFIENVDVARTAMQDGTRRGAAFLGKLYSDPVELGNFEKHLWRLYDLSARHDVPGTDYALLKECSDVISNPQRELFGDD